MGNIFNVVSRLFSAIFSRMPYIIDHLSREAILQVGAVLLIIGFSIGVIRRLVHNG